MQFFHTIIKIARFEFLIAVRNRVIWSLAFVSWLMIGFAAYTGWQKSYINEQQKRYAGELFLHEWEDQHDNPHSAAHFGTYLFKPGSVLNAYDNGLNEYLGVSYRVEAHRQHELNQAEVQQTGIVQRFGRFSISFIFQIIIPLFILLITYNSLSGERQSGTLKIQQVQGVRPFQLLMGKVWGFYAVILGVVLIPILAMAVPVLGESGGLEVIKRYGLYCLSYLLYFFIFTSIGVLFSAWFKTDRASLIAGLGFWIVLTMLLPKIAVRSIDRHYPLPSRYELNRNISIGYKKGMGTDGSAYDRYDKYLKQTLDRYGVDSVQQLPVNFDGLVMQFGEDYNTKVYAFFSGNIEDTILKQQTSVERAGFLNPFTAIQQLSMGFTATDYQHHLSFYHQAQHYRNQFVRDLNMDLANSGSEYLSYFYEVGPDFFKKMKKFKYRSPSVNEALHWHYRSAISLLLWIFLINAALFPLAGKRLL